MVIAAHTRNTKFNCTAVGSGFDTLKPHCSRGVVVPHRVPQCCPVRTNPRRSCLPPPPLHGLRLPELRLRVLRLRVLRLRVNRYPHYNYGNGGGGSSDVGMGRPMGRRRGGLGGWGATEHSKPEAEPVHPGAWSWRRTRKCGIRFLERLRSAKNKMTLREEEGSKRK